MSIEQDVSASIVTPRDAASIVVIRDRLTAPSVLMGQRSQSSSFMPSRFVFPGGSVDATDSAVRLSGDLNPICSARLAQHDGAPELTSALVAAAIRELWEETGQILGRRGAWSGAVPKGWEGFASAGFVPSAAAVSYVFRAITPITMHKRFDARFFLVDAEELGSDPDDFSRADAELSHLQWIPLERARDFSLPRITEQVLDDIAVILGHDMKVPEVRFFYNAPGVSEFRTIL
ncbi:NUDIX hydrolase [Martelella limonii]|uniref:NUDIX hydrolase n=1 Tax=Martelella limonii TaxID=1647649 RepID=UPI001580B79C|nr:NUDIX hydrolase [Martelella limonii]